MWPFGCSHDWSVENESKLVNTVWDDYNTIPLDVIDRLAATPPGSCFDLRPSVTELEEEFEKCSDFKRVHGHEYKCKYVWLLPSRVFDGICRKCNTISLSYTKVLESLKKRLDEIKKEKFERTVALTKYREMMRKAK